MQLLQLRRELHKIPEMGFEEFETQKLLLSNLKKIENIKIITFNFTGILVKYKVNEKPFKLIRADMDGLSISERTKVDFTSKNPGMMHACGHDIHMTVLFGLIQKVSEERPQQNLLFIFQPAEEGRGGAKRLLDAGIFDNYQISEAYALHVSDAFQTGEIASKPNIFFANTQEIEIEFIGKSAHVAFPEFGKDALAAAADFYLYIQKMIKTKFPEKKRVIAAFGKIKGGTAMNAVAAKCKLDGTFRAFDQADRIELRNLIEKTAEFVSKKYDLSHKINYLAYYCEVENNPKLFAKLKKNITTTDYKLIDTQRVFTGEDFGFFAKKYPGLLFWLGCRAQNQKKIGLHSPNFLPDEKAIEVGVDIFWRLLNA